jgi:pimeloyl-ACP methyl ester carboxylesterase
MPPSERFVSLAIDDAISITARIRDGEGPAFINIPGTWGNMYTRGPLMDRLDPSLCVVNVALPGQDDNWPPPDNPSIPAFSDMVLLLADHLGIERFFVGGNSLGGMISVDMLRFPERVIGAIPIEGWTHYTVSGNAFGKDVTSTLLTEQTELLAEVRVKLLGKWDSESRERYASVWRQWNGWDILNASELPVLEIWGDRGRERPSLETMQIPDHPNIEVHWVTGCSHSLLVEAPDEVADAINGFINRVAG